MNKKLYECNSYIDSYEYSKMSKYFFNKFYFGFLLFASIYNLLISIVIFLITKNIIDLIGFFLIIEVIIVVVLKIKLSDIAKYIFKYQVKRFRLETSFKMVFYKKYFVREGKINIEEKYSDITKAIETETNFYLEDNKKKIIFIIEKNECDLDLIDFIRKRFDNLDSRIGGSIDFKNR